MSLAWLFPVCRGLFSHKEGAAGKPGGSSPSQALLLFLHLRLAAEKHAKNAIIAGKSTKRACLSLFILAIIDSVPRKTWIASYIQCYTCMYHTLGNTTYMVILILSLSLKFLRTEASYLSLSTQYLVADIQWYLLNVE